MSRDEIIAAVRACARKLRRAPSRVELTRMSGITWHRIYKEFRGMRAAVRAAGLEPGPRGGPINPGSLLLDWARVVRRLGGLPSRLEYDENGRHSSGTLHSHFDWPQTPHHFC